MSGDDLPLLSGLKNILSDTFRIICDSTLKDCPEAHRHVHLWLDVSLETKFGTELDAQVVVRLGGTAPFQDRHTVEECLRSIQELTVKRWIDVALLLELGHPLEALGEDVALRQELLARCGVLPGQTCPALNLAAVDEGGELTARTDAANAEQSSLLFIGTNGCKPCKEALNAVLDSGCAATTKLVLLGRDSTPAAAAEWLWDAGLTSNLDQFIPQIVVSRCWLPPNSPGWEILGAIGVPLLILIDSQCQVLARERELTPELKLALANLSLHDNCAKLRTLGDTTFTDTTLSSDNGSWVAQEVGERREALEILAALCSKHSPRLQALERIAVRLTKNHGVRGVNVSRDSSLRMDGSVPSDDGNDLRRVAKMVGTFGNIKIVRKL